MKLPFAPFAYSRSGSGLPSTRALNVYNEKTPGGPNTDARIQRPGLTVSLTVNVGPHIGGFSEPGVFGGDRFAVSGGKVYREADEIGSVLLGSTIARIAASATQLVVVAGGEAWCYQLDGNDDPEFVQIAIPDDQPVSEVLIIGSRFYYYIADSDRWYFSDIDDATSIDGLAFATADSAPDANVGGAVLGDEVVFFGRVTTEFWRQTGDQDAPLVRSLGAKYDKGCVAQGSIVPVDNRVVWVGHDLQVYVTGEGPQKLSSTSVDFDLERCAEPMAITAFAVATAGRWFYVLNVPGVASWAYDFAAQTWAQWGSFGRETFRGQTGFMAGSAGYIGDALTGKLFLFDPKAFTDDGDQIERVVSCVAQAGEEAVFCNELVVDCALGVGPADGTEPLMDMRYSDDDGRTWTEWRGRSMGRIGHYREPPRWSRLGMIRRGRQRVFELRVTDPVNAVFSNARMR